MTRVQRNSLNRSGLFLSAITVLATLGFHTPGWSVPRESGRTTSRGYGVRAGGIRAVFGAGRIRLQGDAGVGILRFQIPTPASNASRVNLTGELGLGIQSELSGAHFGVGYRLHHLSNAGRGPVNPGIDSHMFYIGLWIR